MLGFVAIVPYTLRVPSLPVMRPLALLVLAALALPALAQSGAEPATDIMPADIGTHWSYDVTERVGDASDVSYVSEVEWYGAGTLADTTGTEWGFHYVVQRGPRIPMTEAPVPSVKWCSVYYAPLSSHDPVYERPFRLLGDWGCQVISGFPDPYYVPLFADRDATIQSEVSLGGEPVSVERREAAVQIVEPCTNRCERVYKSTMQASFGVGFGLLSYQFRRGLVVPRGPDPNAWIVESQLVGAEVGGQLYGDLRQRAAGDPATVFGLVTGAEWVYDVARWTGPLNRDPEIQHAYERWEVVEALGAGRFRLAVTTSESTGECEAEVRTVGEVSVLAFTGGTCPLAFERKMQVDTFDPPRSLPTVPSTYLSVPGVPASFEVGETSVQAAKSIGGFLGRALQGRHASSTTVDYDVAQGLGLHRIHTEEAGPGSTNSRDRLHTERTLAYAHVGTVEVGLPVAQAAAPTQAQLAVAVAPNPTLGPLGIRVTVPTTALGRADVFDVTGRRVAVFDLGVVRAGTWTETLALDGLPSGAYQIRVTVGDAVGQARAVVVR